MKIRNNIILSALFILLCSAMLATGCVPMGVYNQGMNGYYGNQQDYYGNTQGNYYGGGFDTNGWGSAQDGFGLFGGKNENGGFGSSVYSSYAEAVKAFQSYEEMIINNKKDNDDYVYLFYGFGPSISETYGTLFDINGDGSNELILYMGTIDNDKGNDLDDIQNCKVNINFSIYIYTEKNGKTVPVTIPDDIKIKTVKKYYLSIVGSPFDEFTDYNTAYINGTPCLIKHDYGTLSGGDGKTEEIYVCTSNGNGIGINTVLEKKTRTEPVEKSYYSIDGREISESEYNDYLNMMETGSSWYTLDDLLVVLGDTW